MELPMFVYASIVINRQRTTNFCLCNLKPPLLKAHNELDKAVDLAYRPQPFSSEANRMVFLFELYEKYTADLLTLQKPKKLKKQG